MNTFILPNRRMADAQSLPQLATMLDDYFAQLSRQLGFKYDFCFVPRISHCDTLLQVGSLVQVQANGTLKRASRTSQPVAPMEAVIVDILGGGNYVWSHQAIMELAIPDATGEPNQPLYLGNNGTAQATAPTSGLVQQVGLVLGFNGQSGKYLCSINGGVSSDAIIPGILAFLTPGTGLTGSPYDGSTAQTWSVNASYITGLFSGTAPITYSGGVIGLTTPLAAQYGGTGIASYTIGDLLYASGATALSALADVAAGSYLRSGGAGVAPLWSTLKLPNTITDTHVLIATGTDTVGSDSGLLYDDANDSLAIGTSINTLYALNALKTVTGTSSNWGGFIGLTQTQNANSGNFPLGFRTTLTINRGGFNQTGFPIALQAFGDIYDAGTCTDFPAFECRVRTNTGVLTNAYGMYINSNLEASGGTITNDYGLYIVAHTAGGTLNRNIYSAGSTSTNEFVGPIIGGSTATFAGTVTADSTLLRVAGGAASNYVDVGGSYHVDITSVGNVGAGTDDLQTWNVPANSLNTNGDHLKFDFGGVFAANANTKTINAIYGATTLVTSTALVINGGSWRITGTIYRTGAATQRAITELHYTDGAGASTTKVTYTTPAETLSGTVALKCTAVGTADNDIQEHISNIHWYPVQ